LGVDDMRVEVLDDPRLELGVSLMLWIGDRFEQLGIAPGTADILGRTAAARLDQPWIGDARLGIAEALDLDGVLPGEMASDRVADVADGRDRPFSRPGASFPAL
jgi:hypothetical protein